MIHLPVYFDRVYWLLRTSIVKGVYKKGVEQWYLIWKLFEEPEQLRIRV